MDRKKIKKTIKQHVNKLLKYAKEAQHNIFRLKQLAKFGILLTGGTIFFAFMNNMLDEHQWSWYWKLMTAYFIPPAGKESIIPIGLSRGIPMPLWFLSIWIFDLLVCTAILTNWWLVDIILKYIKPVRRWTERLRKRVEKLEKKKYGKYIPFVLLLFMWIPIQGSGAISTSFIGTWLGFKPRSVLIMVLIGSFFSILVITLIYYGILGWL